MKNKDFFNGFNFCQIYEKGRDTKSILGFIYVLALDLELYNSLNCADGNRC
jgi:hypothetical protein